MPPKFKFSKEDIIAAALSITRKKGIDALTARSLADSLGSSPKPIFGLFSGMEQVKNEVILSAKALYNKFISDDMQKGEYPPYKASGMAYIRFAKEESELFKLLFMSKHTDMPKENRDEIRPLLDIISNNLGISENDAYILHLEMWIFVHGFASMIATDYLIWDSDFISRSLSDIYVGLSRKFSLEA